MGSQEAVKPKKKKEKKRKKGPILAAIQNTCVALKNSDTLPYPAQSKQNLQE